MFKKTADLVAVGSPKPEIEKMGTLKKNGDPKTEKRSPWGPGSPNRDSFNFSGTSGYFEALLGRLRYFRYF